MPKISELLTKYKLYLDNDNYTGINVIRTQIFEIRMTKKLSNDENILFKDCEDIFFKKYFNTFPYSYRQYIKNNKSIVISDTDLDNLLVLRNNCAKSMGFNNYYDYMFLEDNRYYYDYKDILKIRDYTLKYIVPLNNMLEYKLFTYDNNYLKDIKKFINNNYFEKVTINEINSNESWHLLYYPYSNKFDIYCKYKNNEKDIFNLSHEYGHIFQLMNNDLFDLVMADYALSEIFSSYSEILCVKSINNKLLINNHIKKILEIIISSVAADEFLEYLYQNINDPNKDKVWDDINIKYNINTSKKWYNDIKRIKYPYRAIDYAIAYISTLYSYNDVSIDKYRNLKDDYFKKNHMDIIKNNKLGNPFDIKTYKSIYNDVRGIIDEN